MASNILLGGQEGVEPAFHPVQLSQSCPCSHNEKHNCCLLYAWEIMETGLLTFAFLHVVTICTLRSHFIPVGVLSLSRHLFQYAPKNMTAMTSTKVKT